jgi:phosphohistidine phosphatase SixA
MGQHEKLLILLRHAHRDTDAGASVDNGLSKMGEKQAENILEYFRARFHKGKDYSIELSTSPKKRCQETIAPIADYIDQKVSIVPELGEARDSREMDLFCNMFFDTAKKSQADLYILCSHGDWIPHFLHRFAGLDAKCSKGSWTECKWINSGLRVERILQNSDLEILAK